MAFLAKKGYKIAPFKVGPDFIDPGYHRAVTGQISRNLDSWMLSKQYNEKIFLHGTKNADIAVVEGVMGLFDGYSGISEAGSTSQMAKWLKLPVILIVNARSMARSAAAIVQGFENFDKNLNFAGVIFNKTGSKRHYKYLKDAVEATCKTPCLGFLPRNKKIIFPERHLGLVTTDEYFVSSGVIAELVFMIDKNTKLEDTIQKLPDIAINRSAVYQNSGEYCCSSGSIRAAGIESSQFSAELFSENIKNREMKNMQPEKKEKRLKKTSVSHVTQCSYSKNKKITIAVARDKAFCFYYQENFEILEQNGAKIVFFSPMEDSHLPCNIDGIYLGGGYPELFADRLSQNTGMLNDIKEKSLMGMPVYGECGGFMYLCLSMSGMNCEKKFSMVGCFPFSVTASNKIRSLGYRKITLIKDTLIGKKGDVLRGHEFHYSFLDDFDDSDAKSKKNFPERIYSVSGRKGQKLSLDGFQINNTLGSYLHIHFGSAEKFDCVEARGCMGKHGAEGINSAGCSFTSLCTAFKQSVL